jgi:hydroxymethylpyrimidine pyrophosphatase-like HAD family hydrolase
MKIGNFVKKKNMISKNSKIIAVDFDGTIVEDRYPNIGKPMMFAFETLKMLQKDGHRLILWTYREGKELQDAVDLCRKEGVEFYAVNNNFPEEIYDPSIPRKLKADIFIDDRNIGGFLGWGKIYQLLQSQGSPNLEVKKKKSFFSLKR